MRPEEDYREWLKKSREDFDFASSVLQGSPFLSQVCFFFQQSAEKYLKTYIVEKKLKFLKIHELRKLLKICEDNNASFKILRDDCDFLSPFYIDTRYPVHWPSEVSKEEALKAQEAALKIKEFVEEQLKGL
ncbi:MAG: HEPN domain-containing protein [Candidatus Margulisiibacteriota bacterium]